MKEYFNKICFSIIVLFTVCVNVIFATELNFVQLSDIHYDPNATINDKSFKLKYWAKDLLLDAIQDINSHKEISFVIVTGDAADKANESDFRDVYTLLNTLNKPWYYELGNHDNSGNDKFTKENQIALLNEINPNGFTKGKTYYSFKPKRDMTFIALDPTYDDRKTSLGYLPPEQKEFLKSELEKAKNGVAVVYMHFPIAEPFAVRTNHELINKYDVKDIFKEYHNPILVLGGHYHATKITQEDNVVYVASPALVSYPNAYRYITIDNKRDKTTITLKYKETNLVNLQEKAKARVFLSIKGVYGEPSDRDTVITIDKSKAEKKAELK